MDYLIAGYSWHSKSKFKVNGQTWFPLWSKDCAWGLHDTWTKQSYRKRLQGSHSWHIWRHLHYVWWCGLYHSEEGQFHTSGGYGCNTQWRISRTCYTKVINWLVLFMYNQVLIWYKWWNHLASVTIMFLLLSLFPVLLTKHIKNHNSIFLSWPTSLFPWFSLTQLGNCLQSGINLSISTYIMTIITTLNSSFVLTEWNNLALHMILAKCPLGSFMECVIKFHIH